MSVVCRNKIWNAPLAIVSAAALWAFPAQAQDTANYVFNSNAAVVSTSAAGQQSLSEVRAEVAQLIEQLAAPRYALREQAGIRLLAYGSQATAALKRVGSADPLEAQHRAAQLLAQIHSETFETTARKFLAEVDPDISYGLPAWDTFRQCAGSSRTGKLLYLDAVRCQPELMDCLDRYGKQSKLQSGASPDTSTPSIQFAAEHEAVVRQVSACAARLQQQQLAYASTRLGDFVTLLLVAASLDIQTPVIVSETVETNVHGVVFRNSLQRRGYGTCLRRLMTQWVPKTHASFARRMMALSLEYDLESVASIARKNLKDNSDLETRCHALRCLARFGDASDIRRVETLFHSDEVVLRLSLEDLSRSLAPGIDESYSAPPGFELDPMIPAKRLFVVQVKDLALATAITLAGENPRDYFPEFRSHASFGIDTRSIASPAEDKLAGQQRIERWLASRSSSKR